jgi:hypothetical protein
VNHHIQIKSDFDILKREIDFNSNELIQSKEVLNKFESFLESEFDITVRTIHDDFPLPIPLWTTMYYVDISNKNHPIWTLNRSKAEVRNYVIKKYLEDGKMYLLKNSEDIKFNEDIKFLGGLDALISKINDSLVDIYVNVDELAKRSKSVNKREDTEILKNESEQKRTMLIGKIRETKKQIGNALNRLIEIKGAI